MQLASIVRAQIHDRDILPGELLPTEAELQQSFGVSRSVARQAMSTLVAEGLVLRSRGRGSVVAPERAHHRIVNEASGLYSQVGATGARIDTAILHLAAERAPEPIPEIGGQQAYRLERVRSIDGSPAAFIRTWLPERLGAELTVSELRNASLHERVSTRFGLTIAGGHRTVRSVAADSALARVLGVHTGAPLLLLEGATYATDGSFVEHFATWHRGDVIAFDITVEPPRRDEAGANTDAGSHRLDRTSEQIAAAITEAHRAIDRLASAASQRRD